MPSDANARIALNVVVKRSRIGATFVPGICCDHALAGQGWTSCPCGASCSRGPDGKIVSYQANPGGGE